MQPMTALQLFALALLVGCAAALGAREAVFLAVLLPLAGAALLVDGRACGRRA